MTLPATSDERFMARALELARQGEGYVEPNPMVGAVVVRNGKIVGEGYHQRFGGPHAEVHALAAAGEAARGGTIYVTLEPCCHTGKTPPCTAAIEQAGVARVVAAVEDPFPQVAGGGLAQLRQEGIVCDTGVLADEARSLLAPYLMLITGGRPWVIAKWAMTLDGKLATRTGSSQWISSEASRAVVHQLRSRVDAILVGAGTARADDPLLTARLPEHEAPPRQALRIVLGSLSPTSQLAQTASEFPLLVVLNSEAAVAEHAWLEQAGGELYVTNTSDQGEQLQKLLAELARRRLTNLLVEGGNKVLGNFFDHGLIDEVHAFIAPKLCGGAGAPSPIGGVGLADMPEAVQLQEVQTDVLEGDIYVRGRVKHDARLPDLQ